MTERGTGSAGVALISSWARSFRASALFIMPDSPTLWVAAGLLWILDASINISMEPFRAFVADKLDERQRTTGFVMQSFFIGVGATLANVLPYLFHQLGVTGTTTSGIPLTVQFAFKLGAMAFLMAVLWTVFTTSENPPADLDAFRHRQQETRGLKQGLGEIAAAIREMPRVMRQLAVVQIFTWLGLFCMWMFFGLTTARYVFGTTDRNSPQFDRGTEWGGIAFAVYSIVCFAVAFVLPRLADRLGRKWVHTLCLACGGIGLLSTMQVRDPYLWLLSMVGVGIAWASILSMPYAMLAGALPPSRMGVYMGIFNFFIVIPEIVASLSFQPLVKHVFGNDPLDVVLLGGASMLVAAGLTTRISETVTGDSEQAVPLTDAGGGLPVQEDAQPAPSSCLKDNSSHRP